MGIFKKKPVDLPRRRQVNLENNINPSKSGDSFKRGRTLVGSIISSTSKIDLGGSKEPQGLSVDSARSHIHHLSIKRRRVGLLLITVVMAIVILMLFVYNFSAKIVISISNTDITTKVDEARYSKVINDYLSKNPFSRLSFVLDESSLSSYVSAQLSEVISVKSQGNLSVPGETTFSVTLRKPVAGWVVSGKQYYVDSKGVSFTVNYFTSPDVQIVDETGIQAKDGVAIASNRFLSFVGQVISGAEASGITINKAVLPRDTTRELDIYIKDTSTYVKLSIDRAVGEQVEDMSRAVGYFKTKGSLPKYIDVRVSGKAFYIY